MDEGFPGLSDANLEVSQIMIRVIVPLGDRLDA